MAISDDSDNRNSKTSPCLLNTEAVTEVQKVEMESRALYTSRHGRQVQFTDRMRSYMQELHHGETSHTSDVLTDVEHELQHVQEEINITELQIAKCVKEIKTKTQSLSPRSVADINHSADNLTAVKEHYDGHHTMTHPLCSSTPMTPGRSSAKRLNQTYPSDIAGTSRLPRFVGSLHGERSVDVDVSHLLHPAVEEIRVHDVYAQPTPLERHSYAQGVGLNPNAPEYTPCVAKTDADFLPDDYVSRRHLTQDRLPEVWQQDTHWLHNRDNACEPLSQGYDAGALVSQAYDGYVPQASATMLKGLQYMRVKATVH